MKDVATRRKDASYIRHEQVSVLVPDEGAPDARLRVMQRARRRAHARPILSFFSAAALGTLGCASPGPPKPPSLGLPRPVSDVTAVRSGDEVTLRFNLPALSTDGQPLRDANLNGSLCRQLGSAGKCVPVDTAQTRLPLPSPSHSTAPVIWTDTLPATLLSGSPRPIAYRIELRNSSGRSGGPSDPIYAAAGAAPSPVAQLRADPMRLGIALHWTSLPGAGEVLLDRATPVPGTALSKTSAVQDKSLSASGNRTQVRKGRHKKAAQPGPRKTRAEASVPGLVTLQAAPGDPSASYTVDATAAEGVPYTYSAFRRQIVQLGGRTLELRSASSEPVAVTWRDIYPPAVPQGLTALGYKVPASNRSTGAAEKTTFAVDLVWHPVNDARLAGYRVYRQTLNPSGTPVAARELLVASPVTTPGFHDSSASATGCYRYSVTAIDPKGNESAPAQTDVIAPAPPN